MQTIAIQTEEIQPGDVFPDWMGDGRPATVLTTRKRFDRIEIKVEHPAASYRSYRVGRTVNVERG